MTNGTLLDGIKTRLGITGTYHDGLLSAYADDVKAYMRSGGVPQSVIDSDKAVGCIARGVADLWNYGSGEGRFSEVFKERVIQLSIPGESETSESDIEIITQEEIDIALWNTVTRRMKEWQN